MSAWRDVGRDLRRAPVLNMLTVTTIAFSLFAFGLFGLVAVNIRAALLKVEERVEIRAFATEGTDVAPIAAAARQVQGYPEVMSATVVTEQQALARARQELGEFSDVFEEGFLPASIDVRLKEGHRDPASVKAVATRMHGFDFVDDVRFGEEWITQLYRLRNIAFVAGVALGLSFAGVAVIIIGATIRMAIMARAREISIMRLVGATDGYIKRPFLLEGMLKGLLGGMLAIAMTYFAMKSIEHYLHFETVFFERRFVILGVLAGALLGVVGSSLSVGRHLRQAI
ncbi:MAG: Cell division protein FtsX [Gemmatimonadetes bacterium]|nr:Cell division protein FtsX [Gemmatimonadota bacterium]